MSSISGTSASPFSVSAYSTRGGTSGIGVALDDPLLLQRPQAQRERARADPLQRALQLAEAAAAVGEVADQQERPLAADDLGGAADGTAGVAQLRSWSKRGGLGRLPRFNKCSAHGFTY